MVYDKCFYFSFYNIKKKEYMKPQIPQYITNLSLNDSPFRFSENYNLNEAGEANTYNNIFAEGVFLNGHDCIYIEKDLYNAEPIFGEYLANKLNKGYPLRLFCSQLSEGQGWGNTGSDLYSKFGLQVVDEADFYCPTLIFSQLLINPEYDLNDPESKQFIEIKPKQGDLIYYVNGKKLFEIQDIENEAPPGFYIFGNRNTYYFKTKLYSYDSSEVGSDNSIPTEIKALDNIKTIDGKIYDIQTQENSNFNAPINSAAIDIIDSSEVDPLS